MHCASLRTSLAPVLQEFTISPWPRESESCSFPPYFLGPQCWLPGPVVRVCSLERPAEHGGPIMPSSAMESLAPNFPTSHEAQGWWAQPTIAKCTCSSFWPIPHIGGGLSGKKGDLKLTAQSLTIYLKQTVTAHTFP